MRKLAAGMQQVLEWDSLEFRGGRWTRPRLNSWTLNLAGYGTSLLGAPGGVGDAGFYSCIITFLLSLFFEKVPSQDGHIVK